VLVPIAPKADQLATVARGLGGLGTHFKDTRQYLDRVHTATFSEWEGSASSVGVRAFKVAKGLADRGSSYLQRAGTILLKLSTTLGELQAIQTSALTQIQQKQDALRAAPTSPDAAHQVKEINQLLVQAEEAQADAARAHRVAQSELADITMFEPYSPPHYTGRFGPLQAAVLDSLVAHRHISAKKAALVAGRLSKLSAKDNRKFQQLMRTAGTDKQRADLFKGIATGVSVAHLASVDQYVSPFLNAKLDLTKQHRIDQGVDYSGSGTVGALGSGIVTQVIKSGSGWDGGGYVQYKLTSGPYNGMHVYYAEGVTPLVGQGDILQPGQPVVSLDSGMEMGFAAGPQYDQHSWAHVFGGGYTEGERTASGEAFNKMLVSLGAPPGQTRNLPITGTAPTPSTPL
jgi:hypothetical protein